MASMRGACRIRVVFTTDTIALYRGGSNTHENLLKYSSLYLTQNLKLQLERILGGGDNLEHMRYEERARGIFPPPRVIQHKYQF